VIVEKISTFAMQAPFSKIKDNVRASPRKSNETMDHIHVCRL
jgi:hypothetical protein